MDETCPALSRSESGGVGEVSIAPSRARSVKLEDESEHFVGFDRPPYLASFNLTGTR